MSNELDEEIRRLRAEVRRAFEQGREMTVDEELGLRFTYETFEEWQNSTIPNKRDK